MKDSGSCSQMTPSILGDPGAVSGGGKKSKRARKNSGETTRRAPGDKVLTDQFQTAGVVQNFCFFVPNHRAARLGVVSHLLTP